MKYFIFAFLLLLTSCVPTTRYDQLGELNQQLGCIKTLNYLLEKYKKPLSKEDIDFCDRVQSYK